MSIFASAGSERPVPIPLPETRIDATRPHSGHPFADVWKARELVVLLARRDIRNRYRHSVVGVGWAILQPVLTVIVLSIFQAFMGQHFSGKIPYALSTMTCLVPWTFFIHALNQCSNCVLSSAQIITKVHFPRLVLPLAAVMAAFADFLIALPLIPVLMIFYGVFPQATILWLPFFVLHLLLLAAAFGIWFSILNTRFRDTANALPFLTQLWFFLSPIAYPASSIPEQWRFVASINPMLGLLEGFRWTLFGGNQPDLFLWVGESLAITMLLLLTGIPIFFASEAEFVELL